MEESKNLRNVDTTINQVRQQQYILCQYILQKINCDVLVALLFKTTFTMWNIKKSEIAACLIRSARQMMRKDDDDQRNDGETINVEKSER